MNASPTRTDEALLAGAGCALPQHQDCDFRLVRITQDEWQIVALSDPARAWIREELCTPLRQCVGDAIVVDIVSANIFVKAAHDQGLRTEFVGIAGKDVL
ncbi:hypothetical protein J2857_005248 [Neorhizobium galegae]|uniref:hypothetical protein n=1 Tax=Neorhizobium galegae TaxID=399 RepID=UPI001AE2746A|nr:hypothetical protein [Neorhizobium galegae]MBP2562457.1 hypothetical protein [Neorhizobium galegae]